MLIDRERELAELGALQDAPGTHFGPPVAGRRVSKPQDKDCGAHLSWRQVPWIRREQNSTNRAQRSNKPLQGD